MIKPYTLYRCPRQLLTILDLLMISKMLEDHFSLEKKDEKDKFEKLRSRYRKVPEERRAEIKDI